MRQLCVVPLLALLASCADPPSTVGEAAQPKPLNDVELELGEDLNEPQVLEDVRPPGSEPLPAGFEGAPIPPAVPEQAVLARQAAYYERLAQQVPEWESQQLDATEIERRAYQLKREMLGE